MLSGAIAAGANRKTQAAISAFALALGHAYQLHNDLADLSVPAHEGSDLMQGKRTITLIRARQSMNASERREFDRKFAGIATANGQALAICESLRRQLCCNDAMNQTREMIDRCLHRAERVAGASGLSPAMGHSLSGLLQSLRTNYFAASSAGRA